MSATRNIEVGSDRAAPSTEGEPAPGELELVRAFVNTRELDPDREELTDPAALATWLTERGLPVGRRLSDTELERAIAFREAVRSLLLANSGRPLDPAAMRQLQGIAEAAPVRLEIGPDGGVEMACSARGVDALVAGVLAAIAKAQDSGTWQRLKACTSEECLWAFYDRSRNRSRHWCSMDVCGNRAKTRTYRAKRTDN
ncbi:MAG: CGNR zinc finger domain-containing protein [bacterium]